MLLVLEDGFMLSGERGGSATDAGGEVVFNTSLSGYQEILTDPSYRGQIVTMTYTEMGNYGVNREDVESSKPHLAGFVVKDTPAAQLADASHSPRRDPRLDMTSFPEAARIELANPQLRANLRHATETIREKRARVVGELPDWEELREAGKAIKEDVLAHLDEYLLQFEAAVQAAGGHVHWAVDADDANAVVVDVARSHRADEVVKVKSLTTDEIGLNEALAAAGIHALETDFAELILQLDDDWPSHILVPAIHRNRTEIRDVFARTIAPGISSDDPRDLDLSAARYVRDIEADGQVDVVQCRFARSSKPVDIRRERYFRTVRRQQCL